MKNLLKKLEDSFAAVAFAEAGEFDTAREILGHDEGEPSSKVGGANGHDCMTGQPSKA